MLGNPGRPLAWAVQVVPPLLVCRMTLPHVLVGKLQLPTAQPFEASGKATSRSSPPPNSALVNCVVQVTPPLLVWRMPLPPTTQPFEASGKATARPPIPVV